MESEAIAMGIIASWPAATGIYGYIITWRCFRRGSSDEWFVAGRRLGLIVLWMGLGAGIYSSYTFLGLPVFTSGKGFSVWAITVYGMIAYLIVFWLIPRLRSMARRNNWPTLADAFEDLYGGRLLGGFVAVTGALWSIPYVQLQIQGIRYIIETPGYGGVDPFTARIMDLPLTGLVIAGGLVSAAGINALQGAIMLGELWGIGLLAPPAALGGYDELFAILHGYGGSWGGGVFHLYPTVGNLYFIYSIIIVALLAFWLRQNRVQNINGAGCVDAVKKNTVLVGIYQLGRIPAILVGLTATGLYAAGVLGPPITGNAVADKSFMLVTRTPLNPWIVGVAGAATIAASLSTAAIPHVSGAIFSRNAAPRNGRLVLYAGLSTGVVALISLCLALYMPDVLIYLLLIGYAGIAQFFPEYVIAMKKPGLVNKRPTGADMASGMSFVGMVKASWGRPYNIYEGLWGSGRQPRRSGHGFASYRLRGRIWRGA